MYKYSPENAHTYSELGVIGTTYEVSFNEMIRLLGDVSGKTILDYGTGAGRSALLLGSLGARSVVGVDHDQQMIAQATKKSTEGISFLLIENNHIPLPDNSVDVAVSAHVFVEMKTIQEMGAAAQEIARVLKPAGQFILISTNPDSVGHDYVSYTYKKDQPLTSGNPMTCVVKGEHPFEIDDTYWTETDYRSVLETAGFTEVGISYPLAEGTEWLDETDVAPDIVLDSTLMKVMSET